MAFGRRRAPRATTTTKTTPTLTTTTKTKPTLMGRLKGRRTRVTTRTRPAKTSRFGRTRAPRTTQTGVAPRRKTTIGDKVSGAMMKLRGSLTRRPGVKAAGTRRMHGTDGRATRRVY